MEMLLGVFTLIPLSNCSLILIYNFWVILELFLRCNSYPGIH